MLKLILFDFDGTLADTKHYVLQAINEAFAARHIDIKLSMEQLEGKPLLQSLGSHLPFDESIAKELLEELKTRIESHEKDIWVKEGIVTQLQQIKIPLAILTSNRASFVQAVIKKSKITFHFITADAPLFHKDQVLLELLQQRRLSPEEVLYVGDEVRDIEACKRIGMPILAVGWGLNKKKLLEKYEPDFFAENVEDLAPTIEVAAALAEDKKIQKI